MKSFRNAAVLFLVLLAAVVAGCSTECAERRPCRVLVIGNSFSVSLMHHMPKIAKALDLPLDLTALYIGGCTLERHMDNVRKTGEKGFAPYQVHRAIDGEYQPRRMANLVEVLDDGRYDIVTVQQGSHDSWRPESYAPHGDELVGIIRKHQPQAKIYVQETWSYTPFDERFAKWGIDQNEMYARLHSAYAGFAKRNSLEIIPTGTAIQAWRQRLPVRYTDHSMGGDVVGGIAQRPADQFKRTADNRWVLNSDPCHLNEKGEYFQALIWVAKLFRADLTKCAYRPDKVTADEVGLMEAIAGELK